MRTTYNTSPPLAFVGPPCGGVAFALPATWKTFHRQGKPQGLLLSFLFAKQYSINLITFTQL